jgi:hypothetical protein
MNLLKQTPNINFLRTDMKTTTSEFKSQDMKPHTEWRDPREGCIVYLSGKMAGVDNNNYDVFNKTAKKWRDNGWALINPAENFGGSQSLPRNTHLKNDYSQLIQHANAIALLPGWSASIGAATEVMIAQSLNYPIYDAENIGKLLDMRSFFVGATIQDKCYAEAGNQIVSTKRDKAYVPNGIELKPKAVGPESICQIADRLVAVDRQNDYGHPRDDFQRIADMASGAGFRVLEANGKLRKMEPRDHVFWMQFTKLSREMNNHKRDNAIDGAGYWKTLDLIYDGK